MQVCCHVLCFVVFLCVVSCVVCMLYCYFYLFVFFFFFYSFNFSVISFCSFSGSKSVRLGQPASRKSESEVHGPMCIL